MRIARPDSSFKKERTFLFRGGIALSLNWENSVPLLTSQNWFFLMLKLMNSLEVRLLWLYIGTIVFDLRLFEIWSRTITCVESYYLWIVQHTMNLFVIVISCPSFLHTFHIVHSLLHRYDPYLVSKLGELCKHIDSVLRICWHKVAERISFYIHLRVFFSVNDKSCGILVRSLLRLIVENCEKHWRLLVLELWVVLLVWLEYSMTYRLSVLRKVRKFETFHFKSFWSLL